MFEIGQEVSLQGQVLGFGIRVQVWFRVRFYSQGKVQRFGFWFLGLIQGEGSLFGLGFSAWYLVWVWFRFQVKGFLLGLDFRVWYFFLGIGEGLGFHPRVLGSVFLSQGLALGLRFSIQVRVQCQVFGKGLVLGLLIPLRVRFQCLGFIRIGSGLPIWFQGLGLVLRSGFLLRVRL